MKQQKELGDLCSTKDLVEAGIFSSRHQALRLRQSGKGPKFVKIGNYVLYHLYDVELWVAERLHSEAAKPKECSDCCDVPGVEEFSQMLNKVFAMAVVGYRAVCE